MPSCLRLALFVLATMISISGNAQEPIGKMGDIELRIPELKLLIDAQPPEARKQLATDFLQLERLARGELLRKATLADARQKGWDKKPELQALIERARDQVVMAAFVSSLSRIPEDYPSEDELKQFYESNKSQLMAPAQYQIAQIFLPASDDSEKSVQAEALKKITDLSARLAKPGADFGKLATEFSGHKESAARGGEIGWVPEDQMVPEIRRPASRLAKGEISVPVRSSGGWHILKLLDKKPATVRPLADARTALINFMRTRKVQELERAYLEGLSSRTPPTLNQIELTKIQSGIR
ncbi:MAG: peptidylprolyl isomerase [Burkholderiales bacterium]